MIRVLVADDHAVVREGLKRILAGADDLEVVGEAADGDSALELVRQTEADVILLDVAMPGPGFLRVLERIRDDRPELRILVLSVQPEETYAVRALRGGASGYLMKDHSPAELVEAIRMVRDGRRYISRAMAERLALQVDEAEQRPAHEVLSNREFQVLALIGAGRSLKEIASKLFLSPKTVSTYRARILEKLGLETTAELVRYTVENDIRP